MKLRTKYILFVTIIHLVALVLTYYIFREDKLFFIGAEVFIISSIVIAVNLYQQLLRPLKTLMQGVEAIKDRDFNVKFVSTGKHEMDELTGVYNRMMDELRIERTRQEQQHFFLEKLIQTSPTGIVIMDFDGKIQQINPRAEQALVPALLAHINSLAPGETITVKVDGAITYRLQKSHFIDRGFARHFVMIEDLTAEIIAAEKNVYGKVIRMMSHEVNNTVGPVNSIMESALKTSTDKLKDALQVAIDRNHHLNHFMRNYADLVKLPAPQKTLVDINLLLNSVSALMVIKAKDSHIKFEYHSSPCLIMADNLQMEQALINVVKNAIEAIGNNGTIRFTTTKNTLVIADDGPGISPEEATELFSPFFSTKKDGQGIGLTLVREILLGHDYNFKLKTISAGNTIFKIIFNGT
jgi:two-component system nitrogen regulation sensor histidine kinase NtrY